MSQSIIPFIFMFVAMAVIAFSLILYVYRRGKSSKGVYTAKALEFIAKKYPTIDTRNIKCVEFWSSMGIMGNADVALVAYNDDDMYMMSVIPRSIPGFYRIVPNEESEWDMFYYPMSSIEQAGFDEKQKNFIFTVNGRSIKLKIRKRNGFQEDQQAELHDFFTTISQALQKNKALNV